MKTKEEIQANMAQAQASGTQEYHKFSILFPRILLTDGVQQLCEDAQCFWLMDIIGSHQPKIKNQPFQVWKLAVKDRSGKVSATDGNDKVIAKQNVPYTDFPLEELTLYVADGGGRYQVIMLTSE